MHFEGNCMGMVHVSWLDPHKKREMTIVGSKKMVVYNDIDPLEKIKVFDNGVEKPALLRVLRRDPVQLPVRRHLQPPHQGERAAEK